MNPKEVFEKSVTGLQQYLEDSGLKSMVLGISGGIDSTVCAVICHEVARRTGLGFYGVSLPCSSNKGDEIGTADKVGKAFVKEGYWWKRNIQSEFETLEALCSEQVSSTPISQGNIKARLRMLYLRNLAGITGGVMIDTDNLTEHYLGFFTIAGDQGDISPIAELWKHEVYELAEWIVQEYCKTEEQKEAVRDSIGLTPTDGNGVAEGGDLAQIAPSLKSYNELDQILKVIVENGEAVEEVMKRYKGTSYKRKQLPVRISLF